MKKTFHNAVRVLMVVLLLGVLGCGNALPPCSGITQDMRDSCVGSDLVLCLELENFESVRDAGSSAAGALETGIANCEAACRLGGAATGCELICEDCISAIVNSVW